MKEITLQSDKKYTINDVCLVAQNKAEVVIGKDVLETVRKNFLQAKQLQKEKVYGLTTGVADLSLQNPKVSNDEFQKNILLSHSVGVGECLPKEVVRATIFSRLIVLSQGMSGVSPELLVFMSELLNKDVIPVVPSLGSIGASDLTILAGTFVCLCNKGQVLYKDQLFSPFEGFKKAKISYPQKLQTREGLALINGNSGAVGLASLLTQEMKNYIQSSLSTSALSLEARGGTFAVYNPINQKLRTFKGQEKAAQILETLLKSSSQIITKYENKKNQFLQDPISFKTIAQVFGNAFDTLENAERIVTKELACVADNPLLITSEKGIEIVSSGNYLCTQLASCFDSLSLAIANVAQSSVSRMKILINDEYNEGLPAYLISDNTNNSGFMICVYTAESLLSEIKGLLYPRSVLSSTVANGWEDISTNAFNTIRNTQKILTLSQEITNLELVLALQAMSLRKREIPSVQFGKGTTQLYNNYTNTQTLPVEKDSNITTFLRSIKTI